MANKKSLGKPPKRTVRGRPPILDPHVVWSNANTYRVLIENYWPHLEPLLETQDEQQVCSVLEEGFPSNDNLTRLASLMVKAMKEPRFPTGKKARINFLADSIAAYGLVTLRRSREICSAQRDVVVHTILRYEYWIVCSCGYEGHSENHRCKNCKAPLHIPVQEPNFWE